MKKMQKFIVKDNRIFIGLEDSKRTWKICVRCERMIIHETSMPTEYKNLRSYLKSKYPGCKVKVMYEAGFQGFWLHDLLRDEGFECVVTPPNRVTQPKVNKVKTDKIDARRLAMNLENEDYVSCFVPDKERRDDRQISRNLDQKQKNITATKNRIRRFCDYHGLNEGLKMGSWNLSDYMSLKSLRLSRSLKISLDDYLQDLEHLENKKKKLKDELNALCKKERYREMVESKQNCPGIGWLSAIRFTLEWGEMVRFKTRKKFASYTGLTCCESSTGDTVKKGRITGQSYNQVRKWLIQCAWRAIRIDPVLLNKFQAVYKNSGSKKKAIVAVARKLALRMRALELSKEKYLIGVVE